MFRTAVDQLWGLPVFEEPASPDHHHRARYSCQAHREIEIDFGPCGVASGVAGDHLCRNGKVVLSVGDDILQVKRALLGFRCERKPDSNEQKNVLGYWLGPEDLTVVLAENKVKTLHIFGLMNLHLERQGEYCR